MHQLHYVQSPYRSFAETQSCSELSPILQFVVVQAPRCSQFFSTSQENAPELTANIIAHPLVRKVNVIIAICKTNGLITVLLDAMVEDHERSTGPWEIE
jgi:hypothetical protein